MFDSPCPKCGCPVEFFKDESSGRCPKCGHRFKNPNVSFDCAKWCEYAQQCLGVVPESGTPTDPGQGAFAARLIQAVKTEFEAAPARIARPLVVFQHARELLANEGGDPRIILAAALLLEIGRDEQRAGQPAPKTAETDGLAKVKRILEHVGLDEDTIACVCRIIGSYATGEQIDSIEFKVVCDADALARLAAEDPGDNLDKLPAVAENRLKTTTGKARARRLISGPSEQHHGNLGSE